MSLLDYGDYDYDETPLERHMIVDQARSTRFIQAYKCSTCLGKVDDSGITLEEDVEGSTVCDDCDSFYRHLDVLENDSQDSEYEYGPSWTKYDFEQYEEALSSDVDLSKLSSLMTSKSVFGEEMHLDKLS